MRATWDDVGHLKAEMRMTWDEPLALAMLSLCRASRHSPHAPAPLGICAVGFADAQAGDAMPSLPLQCAEARALIITSCLLLQVLLLVPLSHVEVRLRLAAWLTAVSLQRKNRTAPGCLVGSVIPPSAHLGSP